MKKNWCKINLSPKVNVYIAKQRNGSTGYSPLLTKPKQMKNQLVITTVLFFSVQLVAQESVLPIGGEANGTGGSVSYSIGQVAYENDGTSSGNVNQGVQQPFEFYVLEISENAIGIQLSVFPNPTADYLILQLDKLPSNMRFALYDAAGKLLTDQPVLEKESKIRMHTYSNGSYQLKVTQDNKTLKRIQIIKQN